ncbi:MAG: phosphotransferase [Bacteroidales bacterium]|jgi:aminoglycoside/choline kinase family phosphotransferase|nr:phosphotransferase [Bacteroidales bacterium]
MIPEHDTHIRKRLCNLFKEYFGIAPEGVTALPHSGSNRQYFRLSHANITALGVYNENLKENLAFTHFTRQFLQFRINVPKIYIENLAQNIYLVEDLGDTQLLKWLIEHSKPGTFSEEARVIYQKVIRELVKIQILAGRNFDYRHCFPYQTFQKESILFDLNYFKKYFVDTLNIRSKTTRLARDFNQLSEYLLQDTELFFMYRDFQARNIMLVDQEPYFIDYQGGRKGALPYDPASLLFQAKARIPNEERERLIHYYLKVARLFTPIQEDKFMEKYYAFALIRVLQTLGAYGLRGIIEKKRHFIESIPYAIQNLDYLIRQNKIINHLPSLKDTLQQIIHHQSKLL